MDRADEKSANKARPSSREQPSSMSYTSLQALKIKLGSILLDAQLLQPDSLQEALSIAKSSQEPVGKVLLTLGYIDEHALQTALLAQSLMAEGVVDQPAAIAAIKTAVEKGISLPQALQESDSSVKTEVACPELERMLLASEMVTPAMLTEANRTSRDNHIPLGRALVLKNGITFRNLNFALECVSLIRTGRITEEEGTKTLCEVMNNNLDINEAMKRIQLSPQTTRSRVKLGEILTAGKFINERENLAAVERALLEKRLLGDVLIESGLVPKDMVQVALTLQNLASRGVISQADAACSLRRVADEKRSFVEVAEEMALFKDDPDSAQQVLELLHKSGLARPDDVPSAMQQQSSFKMDALKALVASGCITDLTCQSAIDCWSMVKSGALSELQAVLALQSCDRNRTALSEALSELGLLKAGSTAELTNGPIVQAELIDEDQNMARATIWSSFLESKLLIANFALGAVALWALINYCPEDLKLYALCGVLFVVSLLQFALGKSWQQSQAERKRARKERIEATKQTVSRLSSKLK